MDISIIKSRLGGGAMLLQDKMRHTKFSTSEQIVVDFMLEQQEHLKDYSTTMIAQETYTSP